MITYDIIYLTNLPSFYKINLFNRVAKRKRIFIVFFNDKSPDRNDDFYKGDRHFDWISLDGKFLIIKIITILKLLKRIEYNSLIISGWDNILCWFSAFTSPKIKNAIVVESSVFESKTNGLKGVMKRIFLGRIFKSYVPGKSQEELLINLDFKGNIVTTKGVGIINLVKQPIYLPKVQVKNFIYVGRLSPEKNLEYLLNIFNRLPDYTLNIIGYGPLEARLKKIASKNIKFHGAIDNSVLTTYLNNNDALILPSLSEPWGLVVEEALNNGLPVIVSEKVGCASEILIQDFNGIIFSLTEPNGLQKAILKMCDIIYFNDMRINISQLDFEKTAEFQISCYL